MEGIEVHRRTLDYDYLDEFDENDLVDEIDTKVRIILGQVNYYSSSLEIYIGNTGLCIAKPEDSTYSSHFMPDGDTKPPRIDNFKDINSYRNKIRLNGYRYVIGINTLANKFQDISKLIPMNFPQLESVFSQTHLSMHTFRLGIFASLESYPREIYNFQYVKNDGYYWSLNLKLLAERINNPIDPNCKFFLKLAKANEYFGINS